ncbi:MAG: DUF6703 family protein [Dermatophilaceae bacterium]
MPCAPGYRARRGGPDGPGTSRRHTATARRRRHGPRVALAAVSLSFRSRVEHASVPMVTRLNRIPRPAAFLLILAMMALGVFVPRVGFVATLLVAVFIGWLLYLTWPRQTAQEKLFRVAVLAMLLAVAIVQAFPRAS